MNEDQSDNNDDLQGEVEDAISNPDGAAASAKDAAGGAADSAKDLLGSAKDKLAGNPLSGGKAKAAGAAAGAAGLAGSLKGKAGDLLGGADTPDVDVPDGGSSGSSLKERAAAAKANMADAAGSMKDKAAGAAGSAKDAAAGAAGGVSGAASGAADGVKGAGSGVSGGVKGAAAGAAAGVGGLAGSMKDKAAGAADSAKDAAAGATGKVTDAASSATGGVSNAAAAATAGAGGVAASASDSVGAASSKVSDAVTTTTSGGGGSAGATGGGSGGSGSGGGSGGSNDDDDEGGFISGTPISGEWQIIGLGLLVAAFMLFGGTILGWFGGDDEIAITDAVESVAIDPLCAEIFDELRGSDLPEDDYSDVRCSVSDGEAVITGEVASDSKRTAVAAVIAGASAEAASRLTVPEAEEVEEVAAAPETTTTTAAPETTTTTAAPTTTTEAETTTTTEPPPPEPTNMWQALNDSGQAGQLAAIGSALGLQASLEGVEPAQRTLFAPSDEALANLDPATLNAVAADPDQAAALFGYHILPGALLAADVAALDGTSVDSLSGLPLDITVVDGEVFINGDTKVVATDFTADNGVVHIIDTVLIPPTVNEAIGLENIEFEVNSAVITAAGQAELDKAVAFFAESANTSALIEGHTDTDGAEADNLDLSQRRADAVKQYLVDKGIDGERLTTEGFGETQPILVDGVEDKPQSRRIEFRVR